MTIEHERAPLSGVPLELSNPHDGLNLKHVYYFHAVATEGSIARAARRLGVSQSTISEQVKALEEFLNAPLFERRKGGLRLNATGDRVYEHSKVIFRAARRMIQDLNPERSQQDWVLEIGVCPTVSRTLASKALLPIFELDSVFPRVRFGAYRDLLEDLLTGELDLLLSENEPPHTHRARVGVRAISESPLVIVAAPELAARVGDFPRGLSGIPLATYTRSSRYRWEMDTFLFEYGLTPEVIGEADDVSLLAQLAKRGRCAVAVPEAVARTALDSHKLVRLGPVSDTPTVVYAHYAEANTAELVQQALDVLIAAG